MTKWVRAAVLLAMCGGIAGCASTSGSGGSTSDSGGFEYQGTRDGDAESFALQEGQPGYNASASANANGSAGIGPPTTSVGRTIYFDYDSAAIRASSRPVVEEHVRYLTSNPAVSVLIEGHTDERGTREYNIALGDQRGGSVRELMLALGVPRQQISVVSYGEERLAEPGSGQLADAKNRRVEIAY